MGAHSSLRREWSWRLEASQGPPGPKRGWSLIVLLSLFPQELDLSEGSSLESRWDTPSRHRSFQVRQRIQETPFTGPPCWEVSLRGDLFAHLHLGVAGEGSQETWVILPTSGQQQRKQGGTNFLMGPVAETYTPSAGRRLGSSPDQGTRSLHAAAKKPPMPQLRCCKTK